MFFRIFFLYHSRYQFLSLIALLLTFYPLFLVCWNNSFYTMLIYLLDLSHLPEKKILKFSKSRKNLIKSQDISQFPCFVHIYVTCGISYPLNYLMNLLLRLYYIYVPLIVKNDNTPLAKYLKPFHKMNSSCTTDTHTYIVSTKCM